MMPGLSLARLWARSDRRLSDRRAAPHRAHPALLQNVEFRSGIEFLRGIEELVVVASVILGLIHRGVGATQERLGFARIIGKYGHSDAGGYTQLMFADSVRRLQRAEKLFRTSHGVLDMDYVGQQDDEFVAALPAHRVG